MVGVIARSSSNLRCIVLCDLDYTLTKLNTTNELLKIVNLRRFKILSLLLFPLSIIGTILGHDFAKRLLIKLILYGISRQSIEKLSLLLYKRIKCTDKINTNILSVIQSLKRHGPIVLFTASLDVIANKFKELGFTYVIGSPTFYKDEKFIGFYDLYGRKSEVIRNIISKNIFRKIIIFDDSPESGVKTLSRENKGICLFIDRCKVNLYEESGA